MTKILIPSNITWRFGIELLLLLLFMASCGGPSTEEAKEITFENQDISLKSKMKKAMSDEYLGNLGLNEDEINYVQHFYRKNDYKSYWINDSTLTELGLKMKTVLKNPVGISLPKNRVSDIVSFNFIQDEINITARFAFAVNDLENGFIDYETKKYKEKKAVEVNRLDSLINFADTGELRLQFLKFGPNDTTYQVLGKGLNFFLNNYPLDAETFDIVSIKHDSTGTLPKVRKALISKGYLNEAVSESDSVAFTDALKLFQEHNGLKPDGVVGKFTSKCLNESTVRKIHRIILAMDKIRAERTYPEKYIRINIPEYKLRFVANDTLRREHNIVVGTYENQTPQLESSLRKIVVYPFWKVPYSISSKEILPAVQRNVAYLEKNNYKVYKGDVEINPHTVNWRSIRQNAFPYKVIQQPGPKNSLGILKFDFYNEHSVYFHDTPAKGLFGADVRAYSHGCMRTQYPVDLAKEILRFDSISPRNFNHIRPDSLDSLLELGENYEIPIKERFPIYIDYVSVAREGERMIIYHDVYGRDEEYIVLMMNE